MTEPQKIAGPNSKLTSGAAESAAWSKISDILLQELRR